MKITVETAFVEDFEFEKPRIPTKEPCPFEIKPTEKRSGFMSTAVFEFENFGPRKVTVKSQYPAQTKIESEINLLRSNLHLVNCLASEGLEDEALKLTGDVPFDKAYWIEVAYRARIIYFNDYEGSCTGATFE